MIGGFRPPGGSCPGAFFVADTRLHDLLLPYVRQRTARSGGRAILDVKANGLQGPQISAVERYLIGVGFNAQNIDF